MRVDKERVKVGRANVRRAIVGLLLGLTLAPALVAYGDSGRANLQRRYKSGAAVGSPAHYPLTSTNYGAMRDGALALLRQYDPRKHYFAGVGRSPSELVAFLKTMGENVACQIPASAMKSMPSSSRDAEFYNHFDKLIPASVLKSGRTMVLVDLICSGASLGNTGAMLKKYLQHKGASNKVKCVGDSAGPGYVDQVFSGLVLGTSAGQGVCEFIGGRSDGGHEIGGTNGRWSDLTPNPQHQNYRRQVADYMAADKTLDGILTREFQDLTKPPVTVTLPKNSRGVRWQVPSLFDPNAPAVGAAPSLPKMRRTVQGQKTYHALLDGASYEAYRDAAEALLGRLPPDQNIYLGVGRAATPLVAFLENLDSKRVGTLPIDNLGHLKPQQQPELDAMLANFVPKKALKAAGNVVLFGHDDGGTGLQQLQPMVEAYLRSQGYSGGVSAVAISNQATVSGVERIDSSASAPLADLSGEAIKVVSPYSRHHLGRHSLPDPTTDRREKYDVFKSALLDRMVADKSLHDFLAAP